MHKENYTSVIYERMYSAERCLPGLIVFSGVRCAKFSDQNSDNIQKEHQVDDDHAKSRAFKNPVVDGEVVTEPATAEENNLVK